LSDIVLAKTRILVIGLDGAPFNLVSPWIKEDKLPNIAKIARKGAFGKLTSTIPPCTAAAWSSFLTGKNPGKHGVYEIIARKKDSYDITPVNASYRQGQTILDLLGKHGKIVVALNIPFTYPPKEVNGCMVTGMITPPKADDFTYPPSLKLELERNLREYRVHNRTTYREGGENEFLKDLHLVTDMRAEAALYLMDSYDWDFFMVVFNGTDQIQHALWKYMEDDKSSNQYQDAISLFYEKVDQVVGELLKKIDQYTTVIILSDHGATLLRKWIHLNNFLMQLGLLKLNRYIQTQFRYLAFKLGITPLSIYKLLLKLGLGGIRKRISREKAHRLTRFFLNLSDVNWSETKAFAIPGMGQIYVNLRGREPEGSVSIGKEYEALRVSLMKKLEELKDPETGENVIENVYRKEEIYSGPFLDQAPDIQCLPKVPYGTAPEHEFGSSSLVSSVFGISARHTMDGILLISGPNIKSGTTITNAEMVDLTPTILYSLNLPLPRDMDGDVLTEVFTSSHTKSNPIAYVEVSIEEAKEKYEFSVSEEEELKDRLKGLGYLS
jgi:predicted AlkP superfamily phosphohydrolase/phosphomutase